MSDTIDPARLARVTRLDHGSHPPGDDKVCAMEAVAYIAGEPWSDHPQCASPVIAAFMRSWNDALPNDERTDILLPLIPGIVGTRGSAALDDRRAMMAADWLIRVHTPAWLRLAGLTEHADNLAALPEIASPSQAPGILGAIRAAREASTAAGVAAGAAAWGAAWDAAWDAARGAAWDAAWDAARGAAGAAAWAAAWDAAWAAARGAARADARADAGAAERADAGAAAGTAAGAKLAPVKAELQASAVDLVKRMCALKDVQS